MEVKILDVCKVSPPSSSPNDICLPLTFFDLIWLKQPLVEYLIFYESPSLPETFFSLVILPKLKLSLSITLQDFLPIAGNLLWPASAPYPIVRYKNGDGILLIVAQADGDFHHLSCDHRRETRIFLPLVAHINDSDCHCPLVAVKVTLFPNKGFCIGITVHHVVFDEKSFAMFMKSWASLCKHGKSSNPNLKLKPIFNRNMVRGQYASLEKIYIDELFMQNGASTRSLSICRIETPPDRVRGTFYLSGLDVKSLKEFLGTRLGNYKHKENSLEARNLHVSTFTVIYSFLIVCSVKAKGLAESKMGFSIVVDCRARLEPPLPENYFGNCIGFIGGDVDVEELMGDDGFVAAVGAVNKVIKSLSDGVLKGAGTWIQDKIPDISLAASTKSDPYCYDFGWGRPRKADITSIDKTGSISLIQGKDGDGGFEIELSLSKHEMNRFASAFAQGLMKMKPIKAAL